jgi:hypothetical protein
MLAWFWAMLRRREAAARRAEALIWRHGERGVIMARKAADNPRQPGDRRRHWQLVAHIAERRRAQLEGLDPATTYEVIDSWAHRPGSLIK